MQAKGANTNSRCANSRLAVFTFIFDSINIAIKQGYTIKPPSYKLNIAI